MHKLPKGSILYNTVVLHVTENFLNVLTVAEWLQQLVTWIVLPIWIKIIGKGWDKIPHGQDAVQW